MANFDQSNQTVQGDQYNAETINFTQAHSQDEFFQLLKQVQTELEKATAAKAVTRESAIDAETHIKKALLQAGEPTPNKKTLMSHLTSAKELVANVGGLASALSGAIAAIGALF
jgi:hypothetical protein